MINSSKCPKCENNRIAGPHRIHADRSHSKIDLPGFSTATLQAYTCIKCGYTEFYVDALGRNNMKQSGRFLSDSYSSESYPTIRYCLFCSSKITEKTDYCNTCGAQL